MRSAVRVEARFPAITSSARPSSAISSEPLGRVRTSRSPEAIRCAASMMRPSARESICAAALESTTATMSASPRAAHRMWRSLRTAASTWSSGTASRAAPRAPSGSASGIAAYIKRSWTVALLRVDTPSPPASAAATSGRSR